MSSFSQLWKTGCSIFKATYINLAFPYNAIDDQSSLITSKDNQQTSFIIHGIMMACFLQNPIFSLLTLNGGFLIYAFVQSLTETNKLSVSSLDSAMTTTRQYIDTIFNQTHAFSFITLWAIFYYLPKISKGVNLCILPILGFSIAYRAWEEELKKKRILESPKSTSRVEIPEPSSDDSKEQQ